MGKFDNILLVSDFDNTLVYTEGSLCSGAAMPALSEENRRALEYFMAQGGTFSIATGRALPAFDAVRQDIPMNGPTILFNGAAIYDYAKGRYLYTAFLPESVRPRVQQVLEAFPDAACEIFHDNSDVHALQYNELTAHHEQLTHAPVKKVGSLAEIPAPVSKALFEISAERLPALSAYVRSRDWAGEYEIIPSSNYLLELTAKGANKGGMVEKLAHLLQILPENVFCVGDHANDIPMLIRSRIPFAPANAIPDVLDLPGVHVLPDCRESAVSALVDVLNAIF